MYIFYVFATTIFFNGKKSLKIIYPLYNQPKSFILLSKVSSGYKFLWVFPHYFRWTIQVLHYCWEAEHVKTNYNYDVQKENVVFSFLFEAYSKVEYSKTSNYAPLGSKKTGIVKPHCSGQ